MTKSITLYRNFDDLQRAAIALQASGYFPDARDKAQAITKVLAGAELGLPAFASMAGIHVIQGKPVLGANVIATLVKNDPRYDYRIKRCDNEVCILEWFENGKSVGESSFIIQEAQNITTKENQRVVKLSETTRWRSYTSDMLFARAISRGARRFAPGIFGGSPVYTPDEMNLDTDEEGFIDVEYSEVSHDTPQIDETIHNFANRPYAPETLKAALATQAEKLGDYNASDKQRNLLGSLLSEFFAGDDHKRYEVCEYLFGAASTKDINGAMVKKALDWLKAVPDEGGAYQIDVMASKELAQVHSQALIAKGQQRLDEFLA